MADYRVLHTLKDGLDFAKQVGYPLVMKPDHGVGASMTYKIMNAEQLESVLYADKGSCDDSRTIYRWRCLYLRWYL